MTMAEVLDGINALGRRFDRHAKRLQALERETGMEPDDDDEAKKKAEEAMVDDDDPDKDPDKDRGRSTRTPGALPAFRLGALQTSGGSTPLPEVSF